jgi:UDP-glucose 4-epimerase
MGSGVIRRILVTGSNGMIGTRLCERLISEGFEVVGVDWKPNRWNGEVDAITLRFDLREGSVVDKLPSDVDLVIHLAANARVFDLIVDPSLAKDNFLTLFNTLEFARKNKVRFIFASSREVYGECAGGLLCESGVEVKNCENTYSASKLGGEALVHSYKRCFGVDFVILRFANVYGMYDVRDRVVPIFIRRGLEGKDFVVYGKDKTLDFIFIDDAVDGIVRSVRKFDDVKGDTFNIASGVGSRIVDIAEMVRSIMNVDNNVVVEENRSGEVVYCVSDISKARSVLGFEPKVSIMDGLSVTVRWTRDITV